MSESMEIDGYDASEIEQLKNLKANYDVPMQDIVDKYEAAKFNLRKANGNLGVSRVDLELFRKIEEELQNDKIKFR